MNPWVVDLRRIHDDALPLDWQAHVDAVNRRLGLVGTDALRLSLPGLSPIWFNGDVEAIVPRQWTLVISLNHQIGDEKHAPQASELWDWCRTHNRDLWYWRFFRPLVQVASTVLSDDTQFAEEREYATTKMVFVEICPYASPTFRLTADQTTEVTNTDPGFQTAAKVRDILIDDAEPALILLNGALTLASFEAIYRDRLNDWHEVTYTSPDSANRKLWHRQGFLRGTSGEIPVVGFPFLRTRRSHNSNADIQRLGGTGREFFLLRRLRALVDFLPQFEAPNFTFATLVQPEPKLGLARLPFWSLSPEAEFFVQAAYDHRWVRDFDWPAWAQTPEAEELIDKPDLVAKANVEQLECLLTFCIRQDRFADGILRGAFESGLLTSILRRMADILGTLLST